MKLDFIENYKAYTDKYFLRSKSILEQEGINPLVRYQVFTRHDIPSLSGIDEAVDFIKEKGRDIRIYSLKNGDSYKSGEPIMKLEARVQDLVDLETVYLSIMSGALTGPIDLKLLRKGVRASYTASQGKTILDFSARHFAPELVDKIARICQEEGFNGTSTDVGAKYWNTLGGGTTPHALFLTIKARMEQNGIQGNPTAEGARLFDKYMPKEIPRIILGCTFNKEISDIIETAETGIRIDGTRIDTCGENYTEGSQNIILPKLNVNEKYLRGKGVTIASVWGLRRGLDQAGLENLSIAISSGFDAEKIKAFVEADRVYQNEYGRELFNVIGTGSFGLKNLIMTTSDICAYFNEKKGLWLPMSKVGRFELPSKRLRRKQ